MKAFDLIPILLFTMWSCGTKDTSPVIIHESVRDNHMNATDMVVSIEDNLPDMHSFTLLIPAGDTLLFHDKKGELQFAAYDILADTTIGQFGKFGNGPGEIANFGSTFYNPNSKILYGYNANKNIVSGFYLPRAVTNQDYDAFDKFKMKTFMNPILCPYYINDSTIYCMVYASKGTAEFQLANWNFITNKVVPFDSIDYYDNAKFVITLSPEKDRIFAADKQQDIRSIYTLDGKLCRRIFGPDYTGKINTRDSYFSAPEICGDKLILRYSGPGNNNSKQIIYNTLIITNLDGNYIKTLDFDFSINSIAYHAKTNRLYMTTDGEPQFCYLPLDKLK